MLLLIFASLGVLVFEDEVNLDLSASSSRSIASRKVPCLWNHIDQDQT